VGWHVGLSISRGHPVFPVTYNPEVFGRRIAYSMAVRHTDLFRGDRNEEK
jgi:hypothetical protein